VLWLSLDEVKRLVAGELPGEKVVPHDEVYFTNLLRAMMLANRKL
jgi:hypothetical protein